MIPLVRSSHYQLSGESHLCLFDMRFELMVSNVTQFWIVHHRSISFTIWRQESNLSPLHLCRTSSSAVNIRYINPDSNYLTRPSRSAFPIIDCVPIGHRFRCASRDITALWSTSYSNWYVQLCIDSSNVNEIQRFFPTAVVTAAFVDLFCDPKLFISPLSSNVPRNHRIIFIITFFLGGIVGAGIIKTVGSGYVLFVAGIIKLVVAGSILFLDGTKGTHEDAEKSVDKAKESDEDDFHSPTKRTTEGVIDSSRPLTEIMFADGELTRINTRVSMESIKTIVV